MGVRIGFFSPYLTARMSVLKAILSPRPQYNRESSDYFTATRLTARTSRMFIANAIESLRPGKLERPPLAGLDTRDAYPMKVIPSGPTGEMLAKFLKTGDRRILERLIERTPIHMTRPLIIDVMDLSTSLGFGPIPNLVAQSQAAQLFQLGKEPPRNAQLWQFGVSNAIRLLHPNSGGPVDLRKLKVFTPGDLTETTEDGNGGLLSAGSRLSDALYLAAELARAYRRRGFEQKIGVVLVTDGWNRHAELRGSDQPGYLDRELKFDHGHWIKHSEAYASHVIEAARSERIHFRVLGFVERAMRDKFDAFAFGTGLLPFEIGLTVCNPGNVAEASRAVTEVFRERGKFLDLCTRIR